MPVASRRRFFSCVTGLLAGVLPLRAARGQSAPLPALVAQVTGGAPVTSGRVTVDTPVLADNGHSVPVRLSVECPMTAAEHVRSITLLAEKNPRPVVATFHLGPRSGRAEVFTRIRLNLSQRLTAVAQLSDGSFWSGTADVVVTEAACLDEAS